MTETAQLSVAPFKARYILHTFSGPQTLSLRQLSQVLPNERKERYNQDCLIIHRSNTEKVFIFKFGTVVFFNIRPEEYAGYLELIGLQPKKRETPNNLDSEELSEDDFTVTIEPGANQVQFNAVTIPEFDVPMLQLVAHVLAQSSALELIEWEVEDFLVESEGMTQSLSRTGLVKRSRQKLLRFIGQGLTTRHRIVNQLSLLNEPERTWETEALYKLYKELFKNFDMTDRIERLESMLELSSDVSRLLLEIINNRRSELMELIIIVLITIEVVKSML